MKTTTQTFQVGEAPHVVLRHVGGDLVVDGWMNTEVAIKTPNAVVEDHIAAQGMIEIRCDGDCRLQLPQAASVHALAIGGDAVIDSIFGAVEVDSVNGDLQLLRMGTASIGSVKGDLAARSLEGDFRARRVNGDARLHHVGGAVEVEDVGGDMRLHMVGKAIVGRVGGDLAARNIEGDLYVDKIGGDANINRVDGSVVCSNIGDDLTLAEVGGNVQATSGDAISLRLIPQADSKYVVFAGGDATCRVPVECSASVTLQAGGEIGVQRLPVAIETDRRHHSFTLGSGEAELAITAGGDISFIGSSMAWDDAASGADIAVELGLRAGELAQQVASQVEVQMQAATSQLDKKLTELANNDDLILRIQDKVQAAMSVAERKISEAMRQAEQSIREAEKRSAQAETERRRQQWRASPPPKAPAARQTPPPVSDEERLIILRMVDEGKLSVEQAEQLLEALKTRR